MNQHFFIIAIVSLFSHLENEGLEEINLEMTPMSNLLLKAMGLCPHHLPMSFVKWCCLSPLEMALFYDIANIVHVLVPH